MIDLHAHILPGIDDGATTFNESLQMCQMAFQDGIRTIVATPHVGKYQNTRELILEKTEELRKGIEAHNLAVTLLCGADVEFTPEVFQQIERNELLTINNSRFVLLDSPQFLFPPNIERHIERVIQKGIIPIISHPERCLQIQENIATLYRLVKLGAVVQVTAASITGKMGSHAQKSVLEILKLDLAHVIATDTHGVRKRAPVLSEAVENASEYIGRDRAEAMVTTTPQAIIENKPLTLPEPKKPA